MISPLLNPQLHMNVLHQIMWNKIVILIVNQFRTVPLLVILSIPHIKQMYHKLKTSGNSIQEKLGKNLWKTTTTGLHIRDWSNMYINWMNYFYEQSYFNRSVFYSINSWTSVTLLLTFHLLVWMMNIFNS